MTFTDPIPSGAQSEEDTQNLEAISQFISTIGKFAEVLQAQGEPIREERRMEFIPMDDAQYLYPERLRDWLMRRELTTIHVTTTHEDGSLVATTCEFSVKKSSIDSSDTCFYISRGSEQLADVPAEMPVDSTNEEDSIIYDDGTCISTGTRTNNQELNTFLLALCRRHRIEDPLVPDDLSALDVPVENPLLITDQLTEFLQQNAFQTTADRTYELESGRVVQIHSETLAGQTKLTAFTIYYETGSDRRLRADLELSGGLTVNFYTCDKAVGDFGEVTSELASVRKLHPDEGDYVRLAEILDDETKRLSQDLDTSMTVSPDVLLEVFDTADNTGTQVTD